MNQENLVICKKCGIVYDKKIADKKEDWRGVWDEKDPNKTEIVIYAICPLCKEWEEIGIKEY